MIQNFETKKCWKKYVFWNKKDWPDPNFVITNFATFTDFSFWTYLFYNSEI
jgi:hypothetical protein